jgi:uncharacterized protein YfaS (alpha-2-macroglobulin family)
MSRNRFFLPLNCFILITLVLTSCSGGVLNLPALISPTPTAPVPTSVPQAFPLALVETDPPLNTIIGSQSPITFYFNQGMNKPSAESALSGLPEGTFTWNNDATLLFTPTQSYQPNTTLKITLANSVQSASGFGITEPIDLSFSVADYLRTTNILPKAGAQDVVVDAAVAVSFNQPVVALGSDPSAHPSAFTVQPSVSGRGEWINTSTYVFYPDPPMAGGTEYAVSLNPDLKTVTGVSLPDVGAEGNSWKFTTSRPRVVTLEPSSDQLLAIEPEIKLTFNQPMDEASVESNFLFSGPEGTLNGTFTWDKIGAELTFVPEKTLTRNVGYILNVGAAAHSRTGAVTLGTDYGTVLQTYDNFAVTTTDPKTWAVDFKFNSPLAEGDYEDSVKVTPALDNLQVDISEDRLNLTIYGNFVPDTNYEIELSAQTRDRWRQSLGDPYILKYHTPPLPASLNVSLLSSTTTFVRPDEPVLYANAVNIETASVTVSPISLQDYFSLQNSYDLQQTYAPANPVTYSQTLTLNPSQSQPVKLNLAQQGSQLLPGLYYVHASSPQIAEQFKNVTFAASSQVNLTFKLGATEALVWAVDLPSQTPVKNTPIVIYDNVGSPLGSGMTDENGLWKGAVTEHARYSQAYAVLSQAGEDNFALAANNWSWWINAWDFGYSQDVRLPYTKIYMYTDRPMYRPGQTVYFRGAARQAFNGRYQLPPMNEFPLILRDANGTQLQTFNAQLTPYGTFNGQFELPGNAVPGYYSFENSSLEFSFSFQVAEYRKPEINLSVDFSADEIRLGSRAQANVNARYFFDAPAGNLNVKWALYARPYFFQLPGYETGLIDALWLNAFRSFGGFGSELGNLIQEGTGQTTPQGILSIELTAIPSARNESKGEADSPQIVTLEVTTEDESGLPVSARAELRVHPGDFYIGIRPNQWIGTAKSPVEFEVFTADWASDPAGDKALLAEFKQVRWEKATDTFGFPTYTPVYTPVSSSNFVTGADGKARLSFVPPTSGTYMLDVQGPGTSSTDSGQARTQTLIWIGGAGTAAWPDLPNQKLELTADHASYKAGDTASIFIPNPFVTNSLALVTVERGLVSKAEVIQLSGSGREYSLPLSVDDAPNVYVSVTVLGQGNNFRHGIVNLPVAPDAQALNVQIVSNPEQAGPRDNVTFDVAVSDHNGQPVEGEFSFSVVDLAALAIASPNAPDIVPAFYSIQPMGVETGLSLAVYGGRDVPLAGGGGGGGGGEIPIVVREEFPDTAYWNPSLITNSEGRGQVTMTLPDTLTTWQVDMRGLTVDTRVGQAETQIVSTKPLLVRPVTPRFLVKDDHVLMAAIINNNTSNKLTASVSIQSEGFVLDEPGKATQQVDVPSNGRARVEWWGTAGPAESADIVFSATTTGAPPLQDAARPVWGKLPIVQYASPQAFVTGGVLRGAGTQQEVISLPRTFTPNGGGLDVELSPSLAGSLLSALEVMEVPNYDLSAEATLSYILPNIEVYRALNNAGLSDPKLSERVTKNINSSVSRLLYLQNEDGGWSWWRTFRRFTPEGEVQGSKSDPYISSYVFFGLLRARNVGISVDENALQRAGTYLRDSKSDINNDTQRAALDEFAFIQFALVQANSADETKVNQLYDARDRLSPASKAFLALILNALNPADGRIRDLISNIESSAILSSSSAHWETPSENIATRGSTIYTTSVAVFALAQLDSANQVVFNAVRYLAAHRNTHGLWNAGHDNAWAMIALNEAMVGFGDLNADFTFNAALNGGPLANGNVAGNQVLTPIHSNVPLDVLSPTSPNLLTITRDDGLGRLYYNAALKVNRPVEDVQSLDSGMQIERVYVDGNCRAEQKSKNCPPLSTLQLAPDKPITAQLTLTLPHDSYYVMVEDFIPAGTEILNRALKTSQQGIDSTEAQVQFDDKDPFAEGWGWWLFHEPQIRDEGILFTADYLPAGTYVLTYTLIPLQAGEYRVLPAHAWQTFFPEVQGTSAGAMFEITP